MLYSPVEFKHLSLDGVETISKFMMGGSRALNSS